MQIYLVGGAVRDTLLGLPVTDRDWVVVGSSPQEMTAKGFLSVGKDFPVFLHPVTKEEYALARTERKTAPGYHGFVFDTTDTKPFAVISCGLEPTTTQSRSVTGKPKSVSRTAPPTR